MNDLRYLTKSRFKSALECPTKLYYAGKDDYADNSKEDKFLSALAEGGYQVGELSKSYHPDGKEAGVGAHRARRGRGRPSRLGGGGGSRSRQPVIVGEVGIVSVRAAAREWERCGS